MDQKESPLTFQGKGLSNSAAWIFSDYRIHICRLSNKLLEGDKRSWEDFQNLRSALTKYDSLAKRFAWETPFVKTPWPEDQQPFDRKSLCEKIGMSPATLRAYERLGLLPGDDGSSFYAKHHVKRLQWVLFFLKELNISPQGLVAILSTDTTRSQMETLARSAAPHQPVHLSPPSKQTKKRVTYREDSAKNRQEDRDLLHDMGNRIHIIGCRANLLRRKMGGHALSEKHLSIILTQTEQAETILNTMMNRVRKGSRKR